MGVYMYTYVLSAYPSLPSSSVSLKNSGACGDMVPLFRKLTA